MKNDAKINLLDFDQVAMQDYLIRCGEKPFRATQLIKWIHQHKLDDFEQMMNLSKLLRETLQQTAEVKAPTVQQVNHSSDGTVKWLFKLHDGNCIETVFIPESGRGTLCISSQVGCALNCSFCATGAQGFNRDLSVSEIIGQLLEVSKELKVTNVVMMGMGEPLLNYDNVLKAMNLMLDDNAYGLSKYRVTLSTSGLVPAMKQLAKESEVALAVSLHAPNDELRNELVPINKKYNLSELMAVCRDYFGDSKRQVTMEYVMLDGVNDQVQHARELIKCLHGVPSKVNLIPFNPYQFACYKRSSREAIERFRDILVRSGIQTMIRKTRGDDISAACGQLAGDFKDRTTRRELIIKKQKEQAIE